MWAEKSSDARVTVMVQTNWRGKEKGRARYKYKDGTTKEVKYNNVVKFRRKPLSSMFYLCSGVLVGILLEVYSGAFHILCYH